MMELFVRVMAGLWPPPISAATGIRPVVAAPQTAENQTDAPQVAS
jgi:hypothetical protein